MLFESITKKEFNERVKIRFSNILEGFEKYENRSLQGNTGLSNDEIECRIINFIHKLIELNGEENSFVDFYFSRLGESDKQRLKESLPEEDKNVFEEISQIIEEDSVYFMLTKSNMPFLVRLSTREILFSTFYFTKMPCTIWGNYNLSFPCFFDEMDNLEVYREVVKNFELDII